MILNLLSCGLALSFGLCAATLVDDQEQKRMGEDKNDNPFVGSYLMTGGEHGGKTLDADRIDGNVVRIDNNRIVVADKNKKEVYVCTYSVDTSKKPCALTMTSEIAPTKGDTVKGLIEKDGDTVRLIYALSGDAPRQFKTETKEQIMIVMKKK
jgi:uncharacterized protein (TIGR03067 family)